MKLEEEVKALPWPGGSVGGSIVLCTKKVAGLIPAQGTYLGCGFDTQLEHIWEVMD